MCKITERKEISKKTLTSYLYEYKVHIKKRAILLIYVRSKCSEYIYIEKQTQTNKCKIRLKIAKIITFF